MNMFGKTDPKDKEKEAIRREAFRRIERETYGMNIAQLKEWSKNRMKEELTTEMAKQQIAVAKVRDFLDAIATIVRLQSWWRMSKLRRVFYQVIAERREVKKVYFRAIKIYWQSEKMRYHQLFGKFFIAWKEETADQRRLRKLIQVFFTNCIQRMRLSPQAVMAYFNPGEWSCKISDSDNMKIRRLIFQRLFNGWRLESRELKTVRYKASQILSRMMRRTKGPMWVKESTLVSFHMWYRYVKVKRAYRRGEPDPRFTNPFLPQWTKLYKDLTVLRIKRKRSLETSQKLTQLRSFRNWQYLMTVDRTKPVTPLAVAINHFNTVLSTKVLYAWFSLIRERGSNARFRNKIFEVWKQWAPRNRYLREKNRDALEWLRLYRQRKAMDIMITICRRVVGARTEKIKEMRRNFCDRKLVVGAYAIQNMNEHVIMVDCWRRYTYFWRCHRNWKALNAQFTYQWHIHKSKAIFGAWKSYSKRQKAARLSKKVTEMNEEHQHQMAMVEERDPLAALMSPTRSMLVDPNAAELVALMEKLNAETMAVETENMKYLDDHFLPISDDLFQRARKGQLSTKLNADQFFFFCFLYAQVYRRLPNHDLFSGNDDLRNEGYRPRSTPAAEMSSNPLPSTLDKKKNMGMSQSDPENLVVNMTWHPEVQEKLQQAVDTVHLQDSVTLLSQGAVYDPRLLTQVGQHLGDQYLSLFTLVMLGCVGFLAERVIRKDAQDVINSISHPIAALFAASQCKRWEQGKLTNRERSTLTQDLLVHDAVAGRFRSIYLWRNAVLLNLDIKAEDFARACVSLDEHRTVEEEVAEVMKRNKIERLIQLRHKITIFLGHEAPWSVEDRIKTVLPPLVTSSSRRSTFFSTELPEGRKSNGNNSTVAADQHTKDIYSILREYIFLTGRLAEEAREIRQPLLVRDKDLLVHGFLKQARSELQALRRERMSKKDKEAEDEKKEKEAEKARIKKEKEYAKVKKARKKRKAKLKKWKKKQSKKNKKNNGMDMDPKEGPDSAESETASMSSTFSSYDEHDLAGSDKFAVRDLIDGMMSGMLEEEEIAMEKQFVHRVSGICHPYTIFGETWLPYYWKDDPQTAQTYENRMYAELKACLRRLLKVISHDERYALLRSQQQQQQQQQTIGDGDQDQSHQLIFQPFNLKDEYNGLGMYLIDQTLKSYHQGVSPVWNLLPRDYWKFKHVRDRITRECTVMSAVVTGLATQYRQRRAKNEDTDDAVERYQKFLKKTRKQIIEIAEKQQGMNQEDEAVKAAKMKVLKAAEGKLASVRSQIKSSKDKYRLVDMLFTQNNFEAIEDMLKPKIDPNAPVDAAEAAKGAKKNKKEEAPNAETSLKYIEELESKIRVMEASIPAVESKIEIARQELQEFDGVRRRMGRLLKSFAEERFNFMVDVQELMLRTSKQLDEDEDSEDLFKKYRKFQLAYSKQLQYFFDDKITERGIQLTKEVEQRKYQELMSRPGTKSGTGHGQLADHRGMSSSSFDTNDYGGSLATPQQMMSASRLQTPQVQQYPPYSSSAAPRVKGGLLGDLDTFEETASVNGPFSPTTPASAGPGGSAFSRLRSSANLTGGMFSSPSSRNLTRSFSRQELQSGIAQDNGTTWSSPSSPAHHMHQDGSSLAMDPEEHLAHMAAAFGDALSTDNHGFDTLDNDNQHSSPLSNTRRSVDEQIALMHFNSPEMVKKREEELRILAEEKAKQAEIQELRMRTFDEYWLAYPRRDMDYESEVANTESVDELTIAIPSHSMSELHSKNHKKFGHDGGDDGSFTSMMSTRATKMWKSIGEAYWRAKEEAVRSLLQQRFDATGLNPDELENVNFRAKDGVDPLDTELDFLQPDVSDNKNILPDLLTPSKLALADQFQHLPSDLWWKYSVVPNLSQVIGNTAPTPMASVHETSRNSSPYRTVASNLADEDDNRSLGSTTSQQRKGTQIKLSVSLKDVVKEGDAGNRGADGKNSPARKRSSSQRMGDNSSVASNPDDAPDPFILIGKAAFKSQKESLAHRARMAMEMADDDFSVDSRMQQLEAHLDIDLSLPRASSAPQPFAENQGDRSVQEPLNDEVEMTSIGLSATSSGKSSLPSQKSKGNLVTADFPKVTTKNSRGIAASQMSDDDSQSENQKLPIKRGPLFLDDEEDTINSEEQERDIQKRGSDNDSVGSKNKRSSLPRIDDEDEEEKQDGGSKTKPSKSSINGSLADSKQESLQDSKIKAVSTEEAGEQKGVKESVLQTASTAGDSQGDGSVAPKPTPTKTSISAAKKPKRGPAKSIRQSFASSTGTEVLKATQMFLNDPEVQGKLAKARQPSVMRSNAANNNLTVKVPAGDGTEGSTFDAINGDLDDDRSVGESMSPFDAIQAALHRVRSDFGDTLNPDNNDYTSTSETGGEGIQRRPFEDNYEESSSQNSKQSHRLRHHNNGDGLALAGSFSYEEEAVAKLNKALQKEAKRRSMVQAGSLMEEDEEHPLPAQIDNASYLDMNSSTDDSQLFQLSFNDSTSQLGTPVHAKSTQRKKKGPIVGSNVRRSMESGQSGSQVLDSNFIALSAAALGGGLPQARPNSSSSHHPISVAEAEALRRSSFSSAVKDDSAVPLTDRDPFEPEPVLEKPLVQQLEQLLYEDENYGDIATRSAVKAHSPGSAPKTPSSLLAMTMTEDDLGFRPSTTDLQEIITGLRAGLEADALALNANVDLHPKFNYFPPEFRQNDPDFQAAEKAAVEEKRKQTHAERGHKHHSSKVKKLAIPIISEENETEEAKKAEDETENNDSDLPKKRVKIIGKSDPGFRHLDPSATIYPTAQDDTSDAVFKSAAARRLLEPTLIDAEPSPRDDDRQSNKSPARKPYFEPDYSKSPLKNKDAEKAPKSAIEEVLIAGIVKPYELKQIIKRKKLEKRKVKNEDGKEEEVSDIDLLQPSQLDVKMRKAIQSGEITSSNTIDAVAYELRKLIYSQEDSSQHVSSAPDLSLVTMRTKLHSRDTHFHEITESQAQTTNFYQLTIPKPSSPDYQRHFVHPKSSDRARRRPTTEELSGKSRAAHATDPNLSTSASGFANKDSAHPGGGSSASPVAGAVVDNSDHNSIGSAGNNLPNDTIVESEFQRTGSPEFWIGVVAQRSRTNSFRSPSSHPNTSTGGKAMDNSSTKEEGEENDDDENEEHDVDRFDEEKDGFSGQRMRTPERSSPYSRKQDQYYDISPPTQMYSPTTLGEDHAKDRNEICVDTNNHAYFADYKEAKPGPHVPGKLAMSFPTKNHDFSDGDKVSTKRKTTKSTQKHQKSGKAKKSMLSASLTADPVALTAQLSLSQSTGALKRLPSLASAPNRSSSPTLGLPSKRAVLYHPKLLKQLEEEQAAAAAATMAAESTSETESSLMGVTNIAPISAVGLREGWSTPMTSLDIIHAIAGDEYRFEVRPSARDALTPALASSRQPMSMFTSNDWNEFPMDGAISNAPSPKRGKDGVIGEGLSAESSLSLIPTKPPPVSALPYSHPPTLNASQSLSFQNNSYSNYSAALPNQEKPISEEPMMVVSKAILPSRPSSLPTQLQPTSTSIQKNQASAVPPQPVLTMQMPAIQVATQASSFYDDEVIPESPSVMSMMSGSQRGAKVVQQTGNNNSDDDEEEDDEMDMEADLEAEMRLLFQNGEEQAVAQGPHVTIHDVHFQAKNALFQNASNSVTMVMNDQGELVPIDSLPIGHVPSGSHHLQLMHKTGASSHSNANHHSAAAAPKVVIRRIGNLKLPQPVSSKKKRLLAQGGLLPPLTGNNSISLLQQQQQLGHNMQVMAQPLSRPVSANNTKNNVTATANTTINPAYSPQFIIRKKSFIDEVGNQHVHVVPLSLEQNITNNSARNNNTHNSSSKSMMKVNVPSASVVLNGNASIGSVGNKSNGGGSRSIQPFASTKSSFAMDEDMGSETSSVLSNISGSVRGTLPVSQTHSQSSKGAGLRGSSGAVGIANNGNVGVSNSMGGNAAMWLPRASRSQESNVKPAVL